MRWLTLVALLYACGGGAPRSDDPARELAAMQARLNRNASLTYGPTVHLYAVLTDDPSAMQSQAAREGMWDAVHGKAPRYGWIKRYLAGLPAGYKANLTLDFADLPHPVLSEETLARLLKGLPKSEQKKARGAKLAVFVRGDMQALPGAAQVRLAGAAVQHIAEQHDGVIIDLLTRKAWTRAAWLAEIKAERLGPAQVALGATKREGAVWLFTRGNPKFGEPDLLMKGVRPTAMDAAKARFTTIHATLLERGGGRAGDASDRTVAGADLVECAAPRGFFDVECARIEP